MSNEAGAIAAIALFAGTAESLPGEEDGERRRTHRNAVPGEEAEPAPVPSEEVKAAHIPPPPLLPDGTS